MKSSNLYQPRSHKWQHNFGLVLKLSAVTGLAASSISIYQGYSGGGQIGLINVLNGIVDGFIIVFLLSSYTLFLFEFWLKPFLRRWNFSAVVLLNTLVYTVLILVGRATGRSIMEYDGFVLVPVADPVARLHFLNAFFDRLTEAILASKAEIYKYVGDEIILTWPVAVGTKESRCLLFFDRFNADLKKSENFFQSQFGVIPVYRAGMHVGRIITGELGDLKKEIAHVGDAMNTTARLAAHCRVAGAQLLCSQSLLERTQLPAHWQARPLGPIELRGKKEALEAVALESVADDS